MQTYLKNGYIVSMDQQDTVFDGGGVLAEDCAAALRAFFGGLRG